MRMIPLLFSLQGRIDRQTTWVCEIAIAAVIYIPVLLMGGAGNPSARVYERVGWLVLAWPSIAISAKRWHDRDKSAWWILIALVPVIGAIWLAIENGFLKGTSGPNRFGAEP